MRYGFIWEHRKRFKVQRMCDVMEVSRSGYYSWLARPVSQRAREDRQLMVHIRSIFKASRETYGSPRVHLAMRKQGICCSRKRVARLMKQERLQPKKVKRFRVTTRSKDNHPKAPNVLNRRFEVAGPDKAWAGDITYLWTDEGWLYLAVLLDLFSRRVVGWATSKWLTKELALAALRRALVERNPVPGSLHHTDQGCQYSSDEYQRVLRSEGLTVSMSRKGDCFDNAVVESFFATLKTELGDHFESREQAHAALFDYIEVFYNRQRLHTSLGGLSPVEAENNFSEEAAA